MGFVLVEVLDQLSAAHLSRSMHTWRIVGIFRRVYASKPNSRPNRSYRKQRYPLRKSTALRFQSVIWSQVVTVSANERMCYSLAETVFTWPDIAKRKETLNSPFDDKPKLRHIAVNCHEIFKNIQNKQRHITIGGKQCFFLSPTCVNLVVLWNNSIVYVKYYPWCDVISRKITHRISHLSGL